MAFPEGVVCRRLQTKDGAFGVGEFLVAAVVAAGVDEFLGGGEIVLGRLPRILFIPRSEFHVPK